jgi:hypothetical protein
MDFLLDSVVRPGFGNLAAYLAAHVLLCLLPAFFIAGAMTALIPKEAITRLLGRSTPKAISYPGAALAGSVLAVCSCTIVPLFAGIYRKGAGLGPAITFLFFAPAANILALVYTGGVIGVDLAFARFALSLAFGIGIGLIMATVFHADDEANDKASDALFGAQGSVRMSRGRLAFLVLWVALLLAGTLKLAFLAAAPWEISVRAGWAAPLQAILDRLVPHDGARGEEGLSIHGLVLITLLAMIGASAWQGLERIHERLGRWTWTTLGLTAATLLVATLSVRPTPDGLVVGLTDRALAVTAVLAALVAVGRASLDRDALRDWLWESWHFVKQIFPLLAIGVFVVGVLRGFIQPEWVQAVAGENTIAGNAAGVAFGVFMYFPTLLEVPIARMFLDLGMHRGPLLAYLMADPELSLQSILIVAAIIGRAKTLTYVALVALFSASAGMLYGAWIDGASALVVALAVGAFVAAVAALTRRVSRLQPAAHA